MQVEDAVELLLAGRQLLDGPLDEKGAELLALHQPGGLRAEVSTAGTRGVRALECMATLRRQENTARRLLPCPMFDVSSYECQCIKETARALRVKPLEWRV